MTPELLYHTHRRKALRFFEWTAIERLYAKPRGERMDSLYPDVPFTVWKDAYAKFKATVERNPRHEHAWVVKDLAKVGLDQELDTLEKAYAHMEAQLKPKRRGNQLKDDKRRIAQREYQREALGDAYVDNPALVSAAKTACKSIAAQGGSSEAVQALVDQEASRLEQTHCSAPLSDAERETLRSMIMQPIGEELMAVGVVERLLLDDKEKQAYFLWGHIKAKCVVGDEIELGQATYKAWCGGDSKAHKNSLNLLSKLKAIRVTWGKKGLATGKATLVKRLL